MQPSDIALELRPRSAWESMDLGLAMLQRWWRAVYAPGALLVAGIAALAGALAWQLEQPWVALLVVWWLKPLYDRLVLHVLSRAVFGEVQDARTALGSAREWLSSGLLAALTVGRFELARSFTLPVRQLEGQRGAPLRERRQVLGRRAHGNAVWLTVVCLHFEAVLYWTIVTAASLLLPASATETRDLLAALRSGEAWTFADGIAYAAAVLVIEPFYVAAGFALYLNRRTLLEGWDLEVALRRLAARFATVLFAAGLALLLVVPSSGLAQEKNPKQEIAEVLKAPEFPHERDAMRWMPRHAARDEPQRSGSFRPGAWVGELAQFLLWTLAVAGAAYALWRLAQALPAWRAAPAQPYRPPVALFGMQLAPESLPADVPAAALELMKLGQARDALALLYRGSLSRLVHERGVQLASSHTELEVLALAPSAYLEALIATWRACAYAQRLPSADAVRALAQRYASL